jgi:hypothetical protein
MKKRIGMPTLLLVLLFTACGSNADSQQKNETAYYPVDAVKPTPIPHEDNAKNIYIFDDPRAFPSMEADIAWAEATGFHPMQTSRELLNRAAGYFAEMNTMFDEDGGELWGFRLHAPFMFVDPETRGIIANSADPYGFLQNLGGLYVGTFPQYIQLPEFMNQHEEIWGKQWGVMTWAAIPFAEDIRRGTFAQNTFVLHQTNIWGERQAFYDGHLNQVDARVLIRLEINALLRALNAEGEATRLDALTDALSIRIIRRNIFGSADFENYWEHGESLALYTNWIFGRENRIGSLEGFSHFAEAISGFDIGTRAATLSGAVYAHFLSKFRIPWKVNLNPDSDLGLILQNALGVTLFGNIAEINTHLYDFAAIERQETENAKAIFNITRELTEAMATYHVLKFFRDDFPDFYGFRVGATDADIHQTPGIGEVWRGNIEFYGSFGQMEILNGTIIIYIEFYAVIAKNLEVFDNKVTAETWTLELNEGYGIIPHGKDFRVVSFI